VTCNQIFAFTATSVDKVENEQRAHLGVSVLYHELSRRPLKRRGSDTSDNGSEGGPGPPGLRLTKIWPPQRNLDPSSRAWITLVRAAAVIAVAGIAAAPVGRAPAVPATVAVVAAWARVWA
jgi:hypothetical protein